ncbi:uncharacterized protein LOC126908292 [Daktulosphaira vitifoliae]|uniref:uncharacterized protein LOC126908292 n=1 Tax=Daktulosphaira vitifoliae TaxID=58002 RepID=UPI0021A9A965|nr:uncharacterized protein LOC126908292 [Daktulosphaira vitifoliae]
MGIINNDKECLNHTKTTIISMENCENTSETQLLNHKYDCQNSSNNLVEKEKTIKDDISIKRKSNDVITKLSWSDLYPQISASFVAFLIVLQPGINMAYSNILLHHLPYITKVQFSWITSLLALSTPLGAILIGPLMDRIGRKNACFWSCLPLLTSWLLALVTNSNNIVLFYLSRLCAGIGSGMSTVAIVYVSEIAHPSYRQILLSLNSVFFSGGILLSMVLINFLGWLAITITFIALTVTNMALIVIFIPESPVWILKLKGPEYILKAKKAIKKIYPTNENAYSAEWGRLTDRNFSVNQTEQKFFATLRSDPVAYKPTLILIGLLTLQQWSGAYMTISYALPIFKSIVPNGSADDLEALALLGIIRFTGGVITSVLSFYVGRRPLMMASSLGMFMSSVVVVLTYDPHSVINPQIGLFNMPVPLFGVMMFVLCGSFGVLVFPWTLISELLPTSVRAIGGGMLVSYGYLSMFVTLCTFPHLLAIIGVVKMFAVFGTVSLLTIFYVYTLLPESLGKSFRQIEEYFKKNTLEFTTLLYSSSTFDANMVAEIESTYVTPLLHSDSSTWKTYQSKRQIEFSLTINNNELEEDEPADKGRLTWEELYPQVLASVVALLLVAQPGINMTYLNLVLKNKNVEHYSELSWLMGVLVLSIPVGAISVGMIMDRIGRRKACLLSCIPLLLAWSIALMSTVFPEYSDLMYACRFLAGFGGGMTSVAMVYISEIAMSSYKQALLSLNSVFFSFGILFAALIGRMVSWNVANAIFFVFTFITMIFIFLFLPESPSWLIKFRNEQVYRAKGSLKALYPSNKFYTEEWNRLNLSPATPFLFKSALSRRLSKRVLKPVSILALMLLLQQLSGCYVVVIYAVPTLKAIAPNGFMDEMSAFVALSVIRFVFSVVTSMLSLRFGRRPLMMISSLGMTCSSLMVVVTYVSRVDVDDCDPAQWSVWNFSETETFPLMGIMLFTISSTLGVVAFPWTLVSELLPTSDRATVGGFLISYAYVVMFLVFKVFPFVLDAISITGVFMVFGAASLAMFIHVYVSLPETLGKHFHEIDEYFS